MHIWTKSRLLSPKPKSLQLHALNTIQSRTAASKVSSQGEDEIASARKWLSAFNLNTIPKSICEVNYSRSSGPGGQNVNKVSSKATLKVALSDLLPVVPSIFHAGIRESPQYARKSDVIVIQADGSRKQSDNMHACFVRLHKLIADAATNIIPGETSEDQKSHVQKLQAIEKSRRAQIKKELSSKKASRRKSNDYD